MRTSFLAACAAFITLSASAALETWTNLDGQKMQAEFLGRKGDYVSFKKEGGERYMYPYAKLSETDQARVDALSAAQVAGGEAGAGEGSAASAAGVAPAEEPMGKVPSAVAGKLVKVKNGKLSGASKAELDGVRYVAVYYSAHWCPPCRAFTPKLAEAYREIKAKRPDFELIFVSSDRSEKDMTGYMAEYKMDFPALRFDQRGKVKALERPDSEGGIPNLVFMTADGKELSASYDASGDYLGPNKVLADIKRTLKL
jgi:nucleoredoxin